MNAPFVLREPVEPFGPEYPNLGVTVAKLRRSGDRKAHGNAVLKAIRSKQRSELVRELPAMPAPNCASGTVYSSGEAILRAVAMQQRSNLLRSN